MTNDNNYITYYDVDGMMQDVLEIIKLFYSRIIHSLSSTQRRNFFADPFYSNSIYLILASIISSGIGLLFWIEAAHYYPEDSVGKATAIISLIGLVVGISRLGLDQSLIRFFSDGDKSKIFSTSLVITTLVSVLMGVCCIVTAGLWFPTLANLGEMGQYLFLALVVVQGCLSIMGNVFTAYRKSRLTFIQNLISGLRLVLLIPLISLGTMGILSSWVLSFFAAFVVSLLVLYHLGVSFTRPDIRLLRSSYQYSAGSYISGTFNAIPSLILPILILNHIGAEDAATYYLAASLSSIISIIPAACSTSLIVEGSYGEDLKKTVVKSVTISLSMMVLAIVVTFFGGSYLLGMLGKGYATNGLELVKLLLIANVLIVPYVTYYAILQMQKKIPLLVLLGAVNCAFILGLSYVFMYLFGLIGIGYALILENLLVAIVITIVLFNNKYIFSSSI